MAQLTVDLNDVRDRDLAERMIRFARSANVDGIIPTDDLEAELGPGTKLRRDAPDDESERASENEDGAFLDDDQGLSDVEWRRLLDNVWRRIGHNQRRTQKAKAAYAEATFWTTEQLANDLGIPIRSLTGQMGSLGRTVSAACDALGITANVRLDLYRPITEGEVNGPWEYRLAEKARRYFAAK